MHQLPAGLPTPLQAFLGGLCGSPATAGATLAAAIAAGGPTANLAARASLYTCGNATAGTRLDTAMVNARNPLGSTDEQRALE